MSHRPPAIRSEDSWRHFGQRQPFIRGFYAATQHVLRPGLYKSHFNEMPVGFGMEKMQIFTSEKHQAPRIPF
ncbi:hypothetical protein AGR4A_pAt30168 [Agrobacterium tumefaciens str. B6]|uniref:Uncharacterized protein n=1 Tax=Agrobacterium tumefaciens str. B6 TaxID=1183423 RepID=A0A822VD91_AGRTU|nr:hypothetical protein [Agrobacterium tumefaciens]CVI25353.1 hypothetical protein AGR4A_pAt30168 [Agrobacterium tumefaciens str. B6]